MTPRALPEHAPAAGPRVPGWRPRYQTLHRQGGLRGRVERAVAGLARCRVCPRNCDIDRLADQYAFCRTGRHPVVSSHFPHFGEEDCLRGRNGSGTIFYTHCNLRCVFCQNWEISWGAKVSASRPCPPAAVAEMMLELQHAGCHNINVVTPEHVVPQVLEALLIAADNGLELPLVYNTSAYDSAESLELLDGVVDVYMPDFKSWSSASAERYLKAADYPEIARERIKDMHRQVGPLRTDATGLAYQGVLLRHLVMPGALEETEAILRWVAAELGPETYVNLMDQYHPSGRVGGEHYPEIGRRISQAEWKLARRVAAELGLRLDVRHPIGLGA
jgi:putative pyruvate formate lyase activating enzyme